MSIVPHAATGVRDDQSSRLVSVQILRGVAALLVVWLHLNVALSGVRSGAGPSAIGGFAQTYQFGGIGVDMFFLISGFVMAFTMQQYDGKPLRFIRQRFLRVAPLAYLTAATWIGILLVMGKPVAFDGILSCITFLPVLPQYTEPTLRLLWTLSFEFTFYLLVMAALALRFAPRQLLWITAALGTAGFVVTIPIALLRWFTHPMLLEFALGIAAFLVWRTAVLSRAAVACLGALAVGLLVAEALLGVPIETNPTLTIAGPMAGPRLLLWALPSFFGLVALLHWRPANGWAVRVGQRLGDASYSIYLTHLIPVRAAAYFLPLPADARWLIGLAAAVGTGIIVHYHVERPLIARMLKGTPGPSRVLQTASA